MRRLLSVACFLPFFGTLPAFADSMYTFTLTGDGHTFQFTAPNPPTVTDAPHLVMTSLTNLPGSVDGTGGYTFGATFVVELNTGTYPVLTLNVSPDASGIQPPYATGVDQYRLFGPTLTQLVSDVPNPNPVCYPTFGVCNDILTFAFVPQVYSLSGYDPDNGFARYALDIADAGTTAPTPEPASLPLVLSGLAAVALPSLRRRIR